MIRSIATGNGAGPESAAVMTDDLVVLKAHPGQAYALAFCSNANLQVVLCAALHIHALLNYKSFLHFDRGRLLTALSFWLPHGKAHYAVTGLQGPY